MREEDIAFLRKNKEKCERKCCFFVSLASVFKKKKNVYVIYFVNGSGDC